MKTAQTFVATIYCGSRVGYSETILPFDSALEWIQDHCNRVGLCVIVVHCQFFYTNGKEPGIVVTLINDPRFEATFEKIREQALNIGEHLRGLMQQHRVSVVFPDETVTLGSN